MNAPFVAQLRDELGARLVLVEREAKLIRRALRVLDERVTSRAKSDPLEDVLRELGGAPGTRASLLALSLGRDVADVQATLRQLEATDTVERDGLGWRVRS